MHQNFDHLDREDINQSSPSEAVLTCTHDLCLNYLFLTWKLPFLPPWNIAVYCTDMFCVMTNFRVCMSLVSAFPSRRGVEAIIWATSWENQQSAYAKTKTQISFAVTAKLISAFVFATWIVQYLYFLNTKFPASSHLQWLYSLVCVRPGQNPHCWFSHVAAHNYTVYSAKHKRKSTL